MYMYVLYLNYRHIQTLEFYNLRPENMLSYTIDIILLSAKLDILG